MTGPCLCGDPCCPRCGGDPWAGEVEEAMIAAADEEEARRTRTATALALLDLVEAAVAADHDVLILVPDDPGLMLVRLSRPDATPGGPTPGEWTDRSGLADACRRLLAALKGGGCEEDGP